MSQPAAQLTPQEAWDHLASDPEAILVDVRTRAEWTFVGLPDLTSLGKRVVPIEWTSFPDGAPNPAFLDELRAAGADVRELITAARDAGLQRVTVSLDGLDDAVFQRMNDVGFPVADVLAFDHPFIQHFFLGERGQRAMELLHQRRDGTPLTAPAKGD